MSLTDPPYWPYSNRPFRFVECGCFIFSLVKASFHLSKRKKPTRLRLAGFVTPSGLSMDDPFRIGLTQSPSVRFAPCGLFYFSAPANKFASLQNKKALRLRRRAL